MIVIDKERHEHTKKCIRSSMLSIFMLGTKKSNIKISNISHMQLLRTMGQKYASKQTDWIIENMSGITFQVRDE